jgi:hypothetical protein
MKYPADRQDLPKSEGKFGIASQIQGLTEERQDGKFSKFRILYYCQPIAQSA